VKIKSVSVLTVYLGLSSGKHKIGRLAVRDRRIYFEYDPDFRATGLEISPFKLPVKAGLIEGDLAYFDGLHGVFNDSLPDGWGRLLIDRQLRSNGIAPEALTLLDRLAHVGHHGMGALLYEPDYSEDVSGGDLNLDKLANESFQVLEGESEDIFAELLTLNGSSAGARPKVMVGINSDFTSVIHGVDDLTQDYTHWMVKFPSSTDVKDIGAVEYAYSLMAKAAGIEMMPTHLFSSNKGPGYFGVQRFDRDGNSRIHMHTACGLLHADFRTPSLDYKSLLEAAKVLTKDQREVEKMYRLAVFNVLAHNRDDHSKNFSFLMDGSGVWRVSPAYDLTFSSGPGGEHSTMVMGEGKSPSHKDLLELAKTVSIQKPQDVINQVQQTVQDWHKYAKQAGVSKSSIERIAKVIV
jgi:serine/threonine-protein kinase HipA